MDPTVAVAFIGTAATVATATVGYVVNYKAGKRLNEANQRLAEERHRHERDLAEAAQAHERRFRQGERAYEDRRAAYRLVGSWALVNARQVQATERYDRPDRDPEPPPELPEEEWARMLVEVGLFGSPDVSKAMEDFRANVLGFSVNLIVYRNLPPDEDAARDISWQALQKLAGDVSRSYDRLNGVMRDELAGL